MPQESTCPVREKFAQDLLKENMTPITFKQLTIEQSAWAQKNFPNALPHLPLLGMGEELGELFTSETQEDEKDAVGDILIYACDYAWRNNLQFREPAQEHWRNVEMALPQLFHFHIKQEQGIRYSFEKAQDGKQEWFDNFLAHVFHTARQFDLNAAQCVHETWERVKLRDWNQNKLEGVA